MPPSDATSRRGVRVPYAVPSPPEPRRGRRHRRPADRRAPRAVRRHDAQSARPCRCCCVRSRPVPPDRRPGPWPRRGPDVARRDALDRRICRAGSLARCRSRIRRPGGSNESEPTLRFWPSDLHQSGVYWCAVAEPKAVDGAKKASAGSVRISVSFNAADYAEIKSIAKDRRVSAAWVVREAVASYLNSRTPLLARDR